MKHPLLETGASVVLLLAIVTCSAAAPRTVRPDPGDWQVERGAPYSVELNVDGFTPGAQVSPFGFTPDVTVKVAFGNRFTLRNDQAPLSLQAVGAYLAQTDTGAGFASGDSIRITVFVDASRSGDIANAVVAYDGTATVAAVNELSVFPLAQPVVVRQGDIYIVVSDLTTDSDDTLVPAFLSDDGGSLDPRSVISTTRTPPANPLAPTGYLHLSESGISGNLIVRGYGEPAAPGDLVTGGGESVSGSLPQPTGLVATGASTVALRWTPPALPPPPTPVPVAESEPNDGPATAQAVGTAVIVSGSAQSPDPGSPGGFEEDAEDWYQITVPATTGLTIDLSGFGAHDFDLFLYPAGGPFDPFQAVAFSAGPAGQNEAIEIGALAPGTYDVAVSAFDQDGIPPQSYQLEIVATPLVVRYDVYCGDTPSFPASAATFLGTAPADATTFLVTESAPGSFYRISAVVGASQSQPTAAAAVPPTPGFDTVGVEIAATSGWFLRNANSAGPADLLFRYGAVPTFAVLAGDWDGDGRSSPGLYDTSGGAFFLKNSSAGGGADFAFRFGSGDFAYTAIAGDWDGDGVDTIGLYSPSTGAFFLRDANAPGGANFVFTFGAGGQGFVPIAGDWNGDGIDTVGLYQPATGAFFLRNENAPGAADVVFTYGAGGQVPVVGDWNGDGVDTVGLYVPSNSAFFLTNSPTGAGTDLTFTFGAASGQPVAGNWDAM